MKNFNKLLKEFLLSFLPNKPYCSMGNGYATVIRSKESALAYPQIQVNSPFSWKVFVFDVDHHNAKFSWEDSGLPTPNFIVENPVNGHCHLYYVLKTGIATHNTARMNPIRYAKAIYYAMNKKLNGDFAFTGLLSHNPLHEQWHTMFLHTNTYSLDELAADLDLPTADELEKRKKYQELLEYGQLLGRNCSVFDQLRFWAYAAIRKNRHLSYEKWHQEVLSKATSLNIFTTPLAFNEIKHIAKSVAKWVFKNDAECEKRFLERQSQKGKKSAMIRRKIIEPFKLIAYKWSTQNKMKQEDIAFFLNKSQETISRWLKEIATKKHLIDWFAMWKNSSQQNLKATNTHHEQTVWCRNRRELPIEIQCEFCIFTARPILFTNQNQIKAVRCLY